MRVSARRVSSDDLEASLSKLVSAFLAVAEDLAAEEQSGGGLGVALPPATPVAANCKTPKQGSPVPQCDAAPVRKRRGTKR
jgi:hypothetical protein